MPIVVGVASLAAFCLIARGEVPFEHEPINYLTAPAHDAVALLQAKLQAGKVRLGHDERQGYLRAVLEQLENASIAASGKS